jgi:DNA repair protein RecN (Recombination protein N)
LKSALSEAGGAETLVFDEIDAGIGGRTAAAVGRTVSELSTSSQVVVVTHLAQVAALADRHYVVEKVDEEGPTITRLRLVEEEAVVEELCRMMGGQPEDAEAMAHARQLRHRSQRSD